MHINRTLYQAGPILSLLMALGAASLRAESIRLPDLFAADDVLALVLRDTTLPSELIFFGAGGGQSNVGGLWSLTDKEQSPRTFTGSEGKAELGAAGGIDLRSRDWLICYGWGTRDHYTGNPDAAQLWIDLHAGGQTQPRYSPLANTERIGVSWYGLGRRIRFRSERVSGQADLFIRALAADNFLQRALIGEVDGEDFAGALKIRDAGSRVEGRGWSADARLALKVNERRRVLLTAEGLLGEITWKNLPVEDSYLTSPGVFTDADGFLRLIGGASGASWREDVTLKIVPAYRVEMLAGDDPALLCGIAYRPGEAMRPMLGVAWRRNAGTALDLRLYPAEKQLEIGLTGSGWQLRIAGDDWPADDPSGLRVTAAGTFAW